MKKSIPWFVFSAFILATVVALNFGRIGSIPPLSVVKADVATTSVTVGNNVPTWQVIYEDPASSSSTPTNVESDVNFKGRADDPNGDNWYLIICATSTQIATTTNGGCPVCPGGLVWATSTATDNNTTTATYTPGEGDVEKNDWWAWACDNASGGGQLCTSYSQGIGGSSEANSPFVVNRRPIFDTLSNDGPKDPDQTVSWNTNVNTSDPDSYGGTDTIKLHICKTQEWNTTTDTCVGEYWSSSTVVTSDPSCQYNIPSVTQDKTYNAYAWLVDEHGLEATGTIAVGTASNYDVNNVAPSISAATIQLLDTDGAGYLTLLPAYEESQTPGFKVKATITDNNSCEAAGGGNEISTVTAYVYRELIGYSNCSTTGDSNPNNCYPEISCTIGPCGGPSVSVATTSCTFSLWFLADPTVGSNATDSIWWDEIWLASVKATDDDNASGTTEDSDGTELDKFEAYDLTTSNIPYGSVPPGNTSNEATTTIKATGNVGLDENISGVDMVRVGNSETIAIGQQHYSTTTGFTWGDGVVASSTVQKLELNCPKSTSTSSPATKDTYWLIQVIIGQASGTYNGTNTIAALTGEAQNW